MTKLQQEFKDEVGRMAEVKMSLPKGEEGFTDVYSNVKEVNVKVKDGGAVTINVVSLDDKEGCDKVELGKDEYGRPCDKKPKFKVDEIVKSRTSGTRYRIKSINPMSSPDQLPNTSKQFAYSVQLLTNELDNRCCEDIIYEMYHENCFEK